METKKISRKTVWIIMLILFIIDLTCLGLLIWGIVELCIHSGYNSDILGGLLIGINGFFLIVITLNITTFILNNSSYKQDIKNQFTKLKPKKKIKSNIQGDTQNV